MPTTVLIIAGLAGLAVLLLTWGLSAGSSKDVVQQRLEQLVV